MRIYQSSSVFYVITPMNLANVDVNLFVVLHAVLEEGSATRAAKRLHVTQSAVSNALARLRELVGDPLVVRSGQGLVPTPRAEALAPHVAAAIGELERALSGGAGFAPATSTRTFVLSAADSYQVRDVPSVAQAFAQHLPRATLRVVSSDYLAVTNGMAAGEIDAAFMPAQAVEPGHQARELFEERAALVVRRDHPKVGARFTPALFNALGHIDVEVALGRTGAGHRVAEQHWQRAGLKRQVAVVVPYFIAAAQVAARTDLVAGLPHRLAEALCETLPLRIVPAAFPLPSLMTVLAWHDRTEADQGARYFRQLVIDAVRG
jgi:DNA-binding transcriptional LysR family regulator